MPLRSPSPGVGFKSRRLWLGVFGCGKSKVEKRVPPLVFFVRSGCLYRERSGVTSRRCASWDVPGGGLSRSFLETLLSAQPVLLSCNDGASVHEASWSRAHAKFTRDVARYAPPKLPLMPFRGGCPTHIRTLPTQRGVGDTSAIK